MQTLEGQNIFPLSNEMFLERQTILGPNRHRESDVIFAFIMRLCKETANGSTIISGIQSAVGCNWAWPSVTQRIIV